MKNKNKDKIQSEKSLVNEGLIQHLTVFRLCNPNDVYKCVRKLSKSALIVSEVTTEQTMTIKKGYYESINKGLCSIKNDTRISKFVSIPGIHKNQSSSPHVRVGSKIGFDTEKFLDAMLSDMSAGIDYDAYEASTRTNMLVQPISVDLS